MNKADLNTISKKKKPNEKYHIEYYYSKIDQKTIKK